VNRFVAVLKNLDELLDIPQPSRSRIILEISADMEDMYDHYADEYAGIHLFGPLGIRERDWDYGAVDGYRLMDGSLRLRPRDMAKLGELVADRGNWNGKRVLSAEWIDESTSPLIVPDANSSERYGYLWWRFYIPTAAGIKEAIVANGIGTQLIAIFPELDLIMVTTGSNDDNGMQFAIGRLISMHILGNI
jgi:CubicO group peptidase (beta-lactamase class C family)